MTIDKLDSKIEEAILDLMNAGWSSIELNKLANGQWEVKKTVSAKPKQEGRTATSYEVRDLTKPTGFRGAAGGIVKIRRPHKS